MNIYLLNAPNTYNYGSMMMAENFIYYFDKACNTRNEYYVETDDLESTRERLRNATGMDNIHTVPTGSLYHNSHISRKAMIKGVLSNKGMLSDFAYKMDAVVVLGGDDYTEDYGWRALVSQLLKLNIVTGHKKVYFIGQTMGPFHSFRLPIARHFLSKAEKIYVRDKITFEYLKGMKLKNIDEIPDLALLPLARENGHAGKARQICVFPSELIYKYSKNPNRQLCVDFYTKLCNTLLQQYPEHRILLIPHVLKPESSNDSAMSRDVYGSLPDMYKGSRVQLEHPQYPFEVRELIKQSEFVVSARMHPVISAIECRVPGICFSYSRKYWGIIGEGYGLKEYIIDIRDHDYEELLSDFGKVLDNLRKNHAKVIEKISTKNEQDQRIMINKLKELAGLVK